MKPELEKNLDGGLFDLIGYMVTSARGLLDEPAEYGPFRLAEGVSRLCALLASPSAVSRSRHEDFYIGLKDLIDQGKFGIMSDPPAFTRMLDQAVLDYTRRLKGENIFDK